MANAARRQAGKKSIPLPTATVAAAAAAAVIAARTAVIARALFLRARDIDRQRPFGQQRAMHRSDGFLRFLGCGHGNESEPAGTSGHSIHHQIGFDDRAVRGKGLLNFVLGGVEGKISHKQFRAHFL